MGNDAPKYLNEKNTTVSSENKRITDLYFRVSTYIVNARQSVQKTIDTEMVKTYWLIGKDIVEEEQLGKERADYGKAILEKLSEKLQVKYGRGFGITTSEDIRKFYLAYQPALKYKKPHAVRGELIMPNFNTNVI